MAKLKSFWLGKTFCAVVSLAVAGSLLCSPVDAAANKTVDKGIQLIKQRQYGKAIEELNKAAAANPRDADAHFYLSQAWMFSKQYDRALAEADIVNQLQPSSGRGFVQRSEIFLVKKDPERVAREATQAIQANPKCAEAYMQRAKAYYYLSEFEAVNKALSKKSLEDIDKSIALDPKCSQAHYYKGVWYVLEKKYEPAIVCFTKSHELAPGDVSPLKYRSMVYSTMKNIAAARKDLDAILKIQPRNPDALIARANICEQTGELQKAYDDYTLAINYYPDKHRIRFMRGALGLKLKNYKQSIEDYTHVLQANSLDDEALMHRGDAYIMTGEHQKALADYNEAIDLAPEIASYYESRAKLHARMNHADLAKKDAAKAATMKKRPAELAL